LKWLFWRGETWEPRQSALGNDFGVRFVSEMVIEQWVVNDLRSAGGSGPSFQQGRMLQYQVSKHIDK